MTPIVVLLFIFVALGLTHHRLGKLTYLVMGLGILAYMFYARSK